MILVTIVAANDDASFAAESWPYVLIRWASFLALILMVGAVVFRNGVLVRLQRAGALDDGALRVAEYRTAMVGLSATGALLVSAIARVLAQTAAMFGVESVADLSLVGTIVGETAWGTGWTVQVLIAALALLSFEMIRRQRCMRTELWWYTALAATLVLAFTPAMTGHAMAVTDGSRRAILADGLHIIGGGAWIGTLALLLIAGLPAAGEEEQHDSVSVVRALVRTFSPLALGSAAGIVATGAFAAWLHIGSVPALWQSDYGRVLLAKLGALGIVVAIGAYNFLRIQPALATSLGIRRLRWLAVLELAFAVIVLLITAVLVATPTAREDATASLSSGTVARPIVAYQSNRAGHRLSFPP